MIDPQATVLDTIARYPATEAVFKAYDAQVGECICCRALFDSIASAATRYGLDMERLLADLRAAASEEI